MIKLTYFYYMYVCNRKNLQELYFKLEYLLHTICVEVVFVVCCSLFLNLYVCVSRWNFSTGDGTRILGIV